MSSCTLCFTGFARDELGQVQQWFEQANAGRGQRWSLAPEADADVLVIDMDSMYGHMTWLKAAGSGKRTVGMTAGERCETDFLWRRPAGPDSLMALLADLESGAPAPRAAPDVEPPPAAQARMADPGPQTSSSAADQPLPAAPVPDQGSQEEANSPHPSADYLAAVAGPAVAAAPVATVPHQPALSDLLAPGALPGPVRLQLPNAPTLLLDPRSQTWAGSSTLKPLLPYVLAELEASDAIAIDPAEFDAQRATAQPYMRLLWLCGLSTGRGELLPGFPPTQKLVLTRWPQIEREFPKHFRIATVMMKGPALVADIAEASGASLADVCDFANAGLVSGAVVAEGSAPAGGDPARASALLARPRTA